MKRFLSAFAAVSALLALGASPALAASEVMCQGDVSGASTGSRTIVVTSSTASPQPTYTLSSGGCAVIAQADIGFFLSLGFTQPGLQSIVFTTGVLVGNTGAGIVQMPSLPASAYIRDIFIENTTTNAVTGGIDIGKTSGAADVVSAKTCAASCLTFVADSALLLRVFSKTAQQTLFILGHTDGNSANLNVTLVYGYF